jgi:hypothetical protein
MTVKKKSLKQTTPDQNNINDVINKGGKTATDSEILPDDDVRFTLRVPKKFIEKIDLKRKARVGSVSRNQWILETIAEKLDQ